MSNNEYITPGGLYVPPHVPTEKDTSDAVASIPEHTESDEVAAAVQAMATSIIKAVTEADNETHVSKWLRKIVVEVTDTGIFKLDVHMQDTKADAQDIADGAAKELREGDNFYGKPFRHIEMEFGDGKTETTHGPDELPPGQVPGS